MKRPRSTATAIVPTEELGAQLTEPLRRHAEGAKGLADEARAEATKRQYEYQCQWFETWCEKNGSPGLPAQPLVVAAYISACVDKGLKYASIAQAVSAIADWHRQRGLRSPCEHPQIALVLRGAAKKVGTRPKQKAPLGTELLRAILKAAPDDTLGHRDRALLMVGFAGGFRRSELVAINVDDLTFVDEGVAILVRKSKTDQTGKGLLKVIATGSDESTCPVRLLKRWLTEAGVEDGPVFRRVDRHGNVGERALTGHAVAEIIKRAAARANLKTEDLAGHSLRAGFVTEAANQGVDIAAIMDQTGHTSVEMVRRYMRDANKWKRAASAKLGL